MYKTLKSWIDQIDELDHFPEYDIYVTNTGTKDIYTQVSLTELHKLIPEENYETADVYRIEFTLTSQLIDYFKTYCGFVNEIVIFKILKGEYRRANQQK